MQERKLKNPLKVLIKLLIQSFIFTVFVGKKTIFCDYFLDTDKIYVKRHNSPLIIIPWVLWFIYD